jgi:ankyrin repeat protein
MLKMLPLDLPNEILVDIADHLDSLAEINALARTDRRCYRALNRHLYHLADPYFEPIWAVEHGRVATLRHFIDAGHISTAYFAESLLRTGASKGHLEVVKLFIDYGEKFHGDRDFHFQNALGAAIKGSHLEVMEILLGNGADLGAPFEDGNNPFYLAIESDSGPIIKFLSRHGIDFFQLGPNKSTALHIATNNRKLNAVEALLQCGLDPNAVDGYGNTPIHDLGCFDYLVSRHGPDGNWGPLHKKTLSQVLLEYGADPYLKDEYGLMPLWLASYADMKHEVKTLLEHGVDPNGLDREGNSQVPLTLEDFEQITSQRRRVSAPNRAENGERNCSTPLCIAAYYGGYGTLDQLLKYGANPNRMDPTGELPLQLAVLSKMYSSVKLLTEYDASLDAKDCHGKTALEWAVVLGGHEIVDILFKAGASIDSAGSGSIDPIFRALEYGHSNSGRNALLPSGIVDTSDERRTLYHRHRWGFSGCTCSWCTCCQDRGEPHECERVIRLFLQHGSKLDSRDNQGRSILHQAAFQMCVGAVKFLLEQGADPMSKDSFGQIPLHMACAIGPEEGSEVFERLLEACPNPNHKDINGDTPLHMAARSGFPNGVYLLRLDNRADFTVRNSRGNTPLHEAVDHEIGFTCDDTIIELRKGGADLTLVNYKGQTVWDLAQEDYVNRALSCELSAPFITP